MNQAALDLSILWPALIAGVLVTVTHVPLGIQVLSRGIVFIDLAIAQIAGLGVICADWLGFEPQGWAVQVSALLAACAGALLLTWTDKHWPDVQEALIGATFILAASGALIVLASNPHGAEHLKELLVGQILWVDPARLPLVAGAYALILLVVVRARRTARPRGLLLIVRMRGYRVGPVGRLVPGIHDADRAGAGNPSHRATAVAGRVCAERRRVCVGTGNIGADGLAVGAGDRMGDVGARRAVICGRATRAAIPVNAGAATGRSFNV